MIVVQNIIITIAMLVQHETVSMVTGAGSTSSL